VDPPIPTKRILPSLTIQQVQYLIDSAGNLRDKCIITLLADSGMRLNEITNVKTENIDRTNHTITVWGKGNKQRRAPFTEKTATILSEWLSNNGHSNNVWDMTRRGIQSMLNDYKEKTGLPCNAHTFRRTFGSNLHRRGMDIEHIMRLGGGRAWKILSR
jgi:integrase/recombinase XerC